MKKWKWILIMIVLSTIIAITSRINVEQYNYNEVNGVALTFEGDTLIGLENSPLLKDLQQKRIILTGESHGLEVNTAFKKGFLKYFKEQTDFNYYLGEIPYSQAIMLNQFLATGDTTILDEMYKELKGTFEYTEENYAFWLWLYDYNKTLPEVSQIEVVGIDIEHQLKYAAQVVASLLPTEEAPEDLAHFIDLVRNERIESILFLKEVYEHHQLNASSYEAYLGGAYFNFKIILENMMKCHEAYEDNGQFNQVRDLAMYENFVAIDEWLEEETYFGQWGLNHVFKAEQYKTTWLAQLLNEGKYADQVLTIAYGYIDSEIMTREKDMTYRAAKWGNLKWNFKLGLSKEQYILLGLHEKASPYERLQLWPYTMKNTGPKPKGITTDLIDYILVIRNSTPSTPLE